MKRLNQWTTKEYKILSDAFERDANVSRKELSALLPRHSEKSIENKWTELGFERPEGAIRHKPGWAAIAKLLETRPMSRQEIADKLGCTRANVQIIMKPMSAHWHIAGYRPSGYCSVMTPVIALGAGEDAPYPKKSTRTARKVNPFNVAAGVVTPPKGKTGRVFQQPMDIDELGQSRKEAA